MPKIMRLPTKGFTLVELLVVIAILAILLGLLLPALSSVLFSSQKKICQLHIERIQSALQLYEADYRDYPPSSIAELAEIADNEINSGIESLVLGLACFSQGDNYFHFEKENLGNHDFDSVPSFPPQIDSPFNTKELMELLDPWGNPYIYFHSRDLRANTQQNYQLAAGKIQASPWRGEQNTGMFPGYGKYQIISLGPDQKLHSQDDIRSK